MESKRQELLDALERHYRSRGWKVERPDDGTVRAAGIGGVTCIGLAVVPDDLDSPSFEETLLELGSQHMPRGELCPLELLPDPACADDVRKTVSRLRLAERGHVEVYSAAA